jgi:hypothetical protein
VSFNLIKLALEIVEIFEKKYGEIGLIQFKDDISIPDDLKGDI